MTQTQIAPVRRPAARRAVHAAVRPSWFDRHPAWPLTTVLTGIPLWWFLGLSDYVFVLAAVPMAVQLRRWQREPGRRVEAPPGFGIWLLFLIVAVAGVATLSLTAPGTIASPVSNRLISYVLRTLAYLAATVVLLYAGNLKESELPRHRLAQVLGLVGVYAVIGGIGGILLPHLKFTSPLAYLVPQHMQQANPVISAMLHPGLAQVQTLLGAAEGRPDAPFTYTNEWGFCLALLIPWLLVGWWRLGSRWRRRVAAVAVPVAIVPIVYSLDRTLWIGVVASVLYLAVRLALKGRLGLLAVLAGILVLVVVAFTATPLQSLVTQRLDHGKSNAVRTSLSEAAIVAGLSSPVIGYGDTRHQQGSVNSIAVGRTAKCSQCGEVTIGGTGQLWQLFICSGILGAILFVGFFAFGVWRFGRDPTIYGMAGILVLLLMFVFMFAYQAVGAPLVITMISYALLWRNDKTLRAQRAAADSRPGRVPVAMLPAWRATYSEYSGGGRPPWSRVKRSRHALRPGPAATAVTVQPEQRRRTSPPGPDQTTSAPRRSSPSGLAQVARGGALNLAGAVISALATVGVTILITRHFSKPVAGSFFTATSIFLIIEAVASLGANVGAVNFIARLRSLGEEGKVPLVLRAAIIPVVVVSVTLSVVLLVLAEPLAHLVLSGHLAREGASPAVVALSLRAFAVALPFAALLDTFLGATRGYRDMRPTVAIDKLARSTGQLAAILIGVTIGSVALLAPLWAVPYVPAAVLAWLWLRRIRRKAAGAPSGGPDARRWPGRFSPAAGVEGQAGAAGPAPTVGKPAGDQRMMTITARSFWRFTAPRAVASLAQITVQRIDIVLVALLIGPAQAAVYTAATRFLVAGQFGNSAINQAAQPRFAELFAVRDLGRANVLYRVTTSWLVLLTWPLYLLAVIYGPEVLSVFGRSYQAGDTVMVVLGCTMLVATACGQVDMVLITSGRSSWSLVNGLMALVTNVTLDLFLIPRYGITGAAVAWAIALAITNLTPLAQIAVTMKLNPLGRGTLIAFGLTATCFAAVPLAARAISGSAAPVSIAAIIVGCLLYLAGLWRFRNHLRLSVMPGLSKLLRRGRSVPPRDQDLLPSRARRDIPETRPDTGQTSQTTNGISEESGE